MRPFQSAFDHPFLEGYQKGVMQYRYRGVRCLRSPIDMAIQSRAIWDLQPRTLIEIGTHSGGGALWLADTVSCYNLDAHVYSIDLEPPKRIAHERLTLIKGDVMSLDEAFATCDLAASPHPWYVIEDSAHTCEGCLAALEFLDGIMLPGDLLVMEDGILTELGLGERYGGGPNRAIAEFMQRRPNAFEIDTELCDMFGRNASYAPNGYLKRR